MTNDDNTHELRMALGDITMGLGDVLTDDYDRTLEVAAAFRTTFTDYYRFFREGGLDRTSAASAVSGSAAMILIGLVTADDD